jgi:hypothetical protein
MFWGTSSILSLPRWHVVKVLSSKLTIVNFFREATVMDNAPDGVVEVMGATPDPDDPLDYNESMGHGDD